ncbi:MAG: hypothetical protein CM1200mP41_38950 [Gammaproteobacteria bacterium]|nr:MAG: hypothetical protein CM1200mP41_38950 [Gammaproteobacteria bacterium]
MYDTPSISRVCYDIYVTPIVSIFTLAIVIWTTQYSFSAVPSLVATAWLAAPLMLFGSLMMTRITRQRSIAARMAGATTTATVEEGMSNMQQFKAWVPAINNARPLLLTVINLSGVFACLKS